MVYRLWVALRSETLAFRTPITHHPRIVLLISYDQEHRARPERCQAVHEVIAMHADDMWRPLFSQWMVETDDSPDEWRERIQPVIDWNDNLLIARMTDEYAGYLHDDAWDWLRSRV